MYSEILTATGITQSGMETFVLGTIAVLILGFILVMYWPFIIAGAAALFCVVVLANHKVPDAPKPKAVEVLVPVDESVAKPVERMIQSEPFDESKAFLQDCVALTDYTKQKCQQIWENREEPMASQDPVVFKLLNVDNAEYKKRRAEALKKPNAVVSHYTFH
jgi:hypothetical protein